MKNPYEKVVPLRTRFQARPLLYEWKNLELGQKGRGTMSLLLLIVVLLIVFGGLPNWGYHNYGYGPSGIGGIILIILIILLLTGRLNF